MTNPTDRTEALAAVLAEHVASLRYDEDYCRWVAAALVAALDATPDPVTAALDEVAAERVRQDAKWGEQNHPDGTRPTIPTLNAREQAIHECDYAHRNGTGTWRHILEEEVAEAFAESDPVKLRAELVQVAAVAVAWVEAIDRRAGGSV